MNTIYVVGGVPYVGDLCEGFATDEEGIKQILRNHWLKFGWPPTGIEVTVDIKTMRCRVMDTEGTTHSFYIQRIEKATG